MDCPITSGHDLADAYVAGTLSEAELDAFEQHFFGCSACLAHVQMLQEVTDGLRRQPGPVAAHRPSSPAWTAGPWLGLALAASLVAAFGWWWQGGLTTTPATSVIAVGPTAPAGPPAPTPRTPATSPAPAPGTPASSPSPAPVPAPASPVETPSRRTLLAPLALVVPPVYVPIAVRGGGAPPPGSFDAAMAHYVAGRHRQAATALQALSEANPTDPGIAFFWGVSELAIGHPGAARDGLTRAIAADVQPYTDEAHFYLAKAHLAEDAVDLARVELQYAVKHEAGPEGEAQRLLAALDRLPR
ncbi:MAG: zf-HC2 domain-containing protein [Vicinamibacteraceae bacterium]